MVVDGRRHNFDKITRTYKKLISQFYSYLILIVEQRFFSSSSFQLPAKNIAWKYDAYYYSWWCTFWKPPFIKNDIVAPNSTSTDRINIYTHTQTCERVMSAEKFAKWTKKMMSRYSFHSILNLNILLVVWMCVCACVFFSSVGIYSPKLWRKCELCSFKRRPKKNNHCNIRGAHCQRKFMVVIHHYFFRRKSDYFCRTHCSQSASFSQFL